MIGSGQALPFIQLGELGSGRLLDDLLESKLPQGKQVVDIQWKVRGKLRQAENVIYSVHTLLTGLKSCSNRRDLQWGRRIHAQAVESQHESNRYVVTALIRMYGKCGSMLEARRVFERIEKPDVVSWNVLLLGYAENGDGFSSLELFSRMKACGCSLNSVTYIAALKACTTLEKREGKCLKRVREIHSEIGCDLGIFLQSTLVDMYGKCGSMEDARYVFESIQTPNVVCWNALLLGYVENGDGLATLRMFSKMKTGGCAPNSVTYVAALKACTSLGKQDQNKWLNRGRQIHSEIDCDLNSFMQSTLIDMYGKCGSMADARRVFDNVQKPDVVSWTTLLLGYAENGEGLATLDLFSRMKACGCVPDSVTYVAALKACASLAVTRNGSGQGEWLIRGREIHSEISCDLGIFVQSTLIDMYGKCGSMVDARCVFDSIKNPDVVSWSALLLGYADNGDGLATSELFFKMKACGCQPDSVTYIAILKACGLMGALSLGRKFHSEISEFSARVVTCLVDFYAKCGSITEAHQVFNAHLRATDVSTWTALLTGYGSFGDTTPVFSLFKAMQEHGFQPNAITFVCILSACSHAGLIEKAKEYFEAMPVHYGVTPTVMHYNCMVDILGRANQLNEAVCMLRKMPCKPDAVTWLALLGACRKWKNVEIGRCAFHSLLDIDKKHAPAYVLMANIYGTRGMWEEQERVLEMRIKLGVSKLPGQAFVYDEVGNMIKFSGGGGEEDDPPEVKNKLEQLLKEVGSSINVTDGEEKEEVICCWHSERRAVVYGMLRISPGEPVRVFKNMRMCDKCHDSIKMMSHLSRRVVMVRDGSRFHVMMNGNCSCGDYW